MKQWFLDRQPFAWMILFALLLCCGQNTPDGIFNRGLKALDENDVIGASLYFDDFIKKFPNDERTFRAYELLANCHFLLRDYANARAVFQEVKQKYHTSDLAVSCDFQIGRTYLEEGNLIKAASHFTEIADSTTSPNIRTGAYSWLAQVYARQTLSASAVAEYEKIYTIADKEIKDPTEQIDLKMVALSGEADIYRASREFEKARQVYLRTMDIIKDVTGIIGIEGEKQNTLINWAHTWSLAEDYISSATIYDQLLTNPDITEVIKPQLIVWKIQSLERQYLKNKPDLTPEEKSVLVEENKRLVKDYSDTDQGINSRVVIAQLTKDSTPTESQKYFNEALEKYQKYISEPPSPDRPVWAMLQIADAYIRMASYTEAEQMIQKVQQSYSNVGKAMQRANGMINYIRRVKAEQSKAKEAKPTASPNLPSATPK